MKDESPLPPSTDATTRASTATERPAIEAFRTLFDAFPDLVVVLDPETATVLDGNDAACELTGYAPDELRGLEIEALCLGHPPYTREDAVRWVQLASREPIIIDWPIRRRTGETAWLEVRLRRVESRGETRIIAVASDTTERRRIEADREETETRFRAVFASARDSIAIKNRSLRYVDVNPGTERLFERPSRDILGKTDAELFGPETAAHSRDVDQRVLAGETIEEIQSRRVGVEERTFHVIKAPMRSATGKVTGICGIARDISGRQRAEEDLRRSEERYRVLVENAHDSILVLQEERIAFANAAALRLFDRPVEELIGLSLDELGLDDVLGAAGHREVRTRHRERLAGKTLPDAYRLRARDRHGRSRWLQVRAVLITWDGGPAVMVFLSDVTHEEQAKEEKLRLEDRLQRLQKLESLEVLAGGVAHDFNNLLMAVLGFAEIGLEEAGGQPAVRNAFERITEAGRRAAHLSRQMLAYSGKGRFVVEAVDLGSLVEEMADLLQASTTSRCRVRVQRAPDELPVEADSTQLRQLVMNLVTNSAESLSDSDGEVTVRTAKVHCDRELLQSTYLDEQLPEGDYACIEVADGGSGMDPEMVKRAFDPFFTTKFTGRGLGLSVVLGVVRGHRGAIHVESERGKGTAVSVYLPLTRRPVPDPATAAPRPAWRGSGTVLLVEDDAHVRWLGRRMLEGLGFQVLTAECGHEAIDIFSDRRDDVVCVLLDLTMPCGDGEEAFREIRAVRADVPVVVCSGYGEQVITDRFTGRSLVVALEKPFRSEELVDRLRSVLEGGEEPNRRAAGAPDRAEDRQGGAS